MDRISSTRWALIGGGVRLLECLRGNACLPDCGGNALLYFFFSSHWLKGRRRRLGVRSSFGLYLCESKFTSYSKFGHHTFASISAKRYRYSLSAPTQTHTGLPRGLMWPLTSRYFWPDAVVGETGRLVGRNWQSFGNACAANWCVCSAELLEEYRDL